MLDTELPTDRAELLGCRIDRLDMQATVERCIDLIHRGEFTQHVSINAAKLVAMHRDPELRAIVDSCEIINADGQAVVWASRLLGDPLPERVAGVDLMGALVERAERDGLGIYILGAKADVLETAVARLRERHPDLIVSGYRDGYFSDEESAQVAEEIRASGAHMLFVAMSSPKKEYWLGEYGPHLDVPFVMGVGGSVDVIAGITRRAPRIWQRLGIEWLYRLLQEPRRMFRRYLTTNVAFIGLVTRGMLARALRSSVAPARTGTE